MAKCLELRRTAGLEGENSSEQRRDQSRPAYARERGDLLLTVNWITGPSRSGDVEMTTLMGGHGPVRLHFVVVDD